MATAVFKLLDVSANAEGEAREASIVLSAGLVSTLFGLLLSSRLAPPFMTGDSSFGTATLAVIVASASAHGSSLGTSDRRARTNRRKGTLVLLSGSILVIALLSAGLCLWHNLERMVQPYADARKVPGFSSRFASLPEVSVTMRDAIIACEDPGFFDHRGFEWRALHSALRLNLREARTILGHSTITQQLAKNLFLTKERTLSRKIKEAAITFALERFLSKERILELYLNVIEYGSGRRGILAASDYYFHKTPKELSLAESAVLAGLVSQASHSPSLRELAVGQRWALTMMGLKWRDRYREADVEMASAIPIYGLLRASSLESEGEKNEPNLQARTAIQSRASTVQHWRHLGLLIDLGLFLASVTTAIFAVRAVRDVNGPSDGGKPSNMKKKMLLAAGTCSLFAMFGLHWYQVNREYALSTVLYAYRHSPNFDRRPAESRITSVVLYAAGQRTMDGAIHSFQDPNTRTAPHFVVGQDGRIFQMVPVERRAWHAGLSQIESEVDLDDFSIGIAIVPRSDARNSYSDLQYEGVVSIIRRIREEYDIPDQRIVAYSQRVSPVEKSEPESFDFDKLRRLLHSLQPTN